MTAVRGVQFGTGDGATDEFQLKDAFGGPVYDPTDVDTVVLDDGQTQVVLDEEDVGSTYLDFVNQVYKVGNVDKTFDHAVTLTRTTPAYAWGADGKLHEFAANTPAYAYDPLTGEALGVKTLGQSVTNLIPSSQTLSTKWYEVSTGDTTKRTYVDNFGTAPDGTQTSCKLIESNGTTDIQRIYTVSYSQGAGVQLTWSIMVKAGSCTKAMIKVTSPSTTQLFVDLTDGSTYLAGPQVTSHAVKKLKNGWFRISMSFISFAGAIVPWIALVDDSWNVNYLGSGRYIEVWQFDLTATDKMMSPIPTSGATATQAPDALQLANLPSGLSGTCGAFTLEWQEVATGSGDSKFLDGGASAEYLIERAASRGTLKSTDGTNTLSQTTDVSQVTRSCIAWDATTMKRSDNGGAILTAPHNGDFSLATAIKIMSGATGYIRHLKFTPSTQILSDDKVIEEAEQDVADPYYIMGSQGAVQVVPPPSASTKLIWSGTYNSYAVDQSITAMSQLTALAVPSQLPPATSKLSQLTALMVYAPRQAHYVHSSQIMAQVVYACGYRQPPHSSQLMAQVVYGTAIPETSDVPSWTFTLDGHVFYVLDLKQQGTFLYDLTTQQWCEFKTQNHHGWNMRPGTVWGDGNRVAGGDAAQGLVWELDVNTHQDEGFRAIRHFVTGGVMTRNREYKAVESVRIAGSFGNLDEMGHDVEATFTMRFSDDWGKTFGRDYTLVLVPKDWGGEIAWRSLGSFMAPGRVFEFEDSGGLLRIDGADVFIQDFDNG